MDGYPFSQEKRERRFFLAEQGCFPKGLKEFEITVSSWPRRGEDFSRKVQGRQESLALQA